LIPTYAVVNALSTSTNDVRRPVSGEIAYSLLGIVASLCETRAHIS